MKVLVIDATRFLNEGLAFCKKRTSYLDAREAQYWERRNARPIWKKITDWCSASFTLVDKDEYSRWGGIQSQQATCNTYTFYLEQWAPVLSYTSERIAPNWPLIEIPIQLEDLFLEWWGKGRNFEQLTAFNGR